jgi:hypothetical protein
MAASKSGDLDSALNEINPLDYGTFALTGNEKISKCFRSNEA